MLEDQTKVENLLMDHVRPMLREGIVLHPTTRLCGDLGICDEDLWEVLDFALEEMGIEKPTPSEPGQIGKHHGELTFADLAAWLLDRQRTFR